MLDLTFDVTALLYQSVSQLFHGPAPRSHPSTGSQSGSECFRKREIKRPRDTHGDTLLPRSTKRGRRLSIAATCVVL